MFRVDGLTKGRYTVRTTQGTYAALRDVATGTFDLKLAPTAPGFLSGRVIDGNGEPVAGITIRATTEGMPYPAGSANTGEDGTFKIAKLHGETFKVIAERPGYAAVPLTGIANGRADLVFRLEEGLSIGGTLMLAAKKKGEEPGPVPEQWGMTVRVSGHGLEGVAKIEANGRFTIRGLVPGHYMVSVTTSSGAKGLSAASRRILA